MNGLVRAETDLFFSDLEGKDFSDGTHYKANLGRRNWPANVENFL